MLHLSFKSWLVVVAAIILWIFSRMIVVMFVSWTIVPILIFVLIVIALIEGWI